MRLLDHISILPTRIRTILSQQLITTEGRKVKTSTSTINYIMQTDIDTRNKRLDTAIVHYRKKLYLCHSRFPRLQCLDKLANALHDRFQQLGKIEDLEEAITYNREALNLRPPGHPTRAMSLDSLALAVFTRFNQQGRIEDLEEAITYIREILDLCPSGHPTRSTFLNNLALAVSTRFDQQGRIEDLEEAITYNREALDLCPSGHPTRSTSLNNLALAVSTRFDQQGRIEDLEEAITYYREALDLCPSGHPSRSTSLNNLALAVLTRFNQQGRIEDLEEAITYSREALDLCPSGHPTRSMSLNSLAVTVFTRFNQQGRIEDLEEAITYYREALHLFLPGNPSRSTCLNSLALAMSTRFNQQGRIEDLEEAIKCNHEALDLFPPGHPTRSTCLTNLALAVFTRFNQQGRIEDLEEAITYNREALDLCPSGHPTRPTPLNNLALAVFTRFNQQGRIEDLEEAITYSREALDLCPSGHPIRSTCLNSLAIAVFTRFNQQGRIEDLEEAITYYREALDLFLPGHPSHSTCLNNLALAVSTRFNQQGRIEDLEEAIKCNHEALDLFPPGHPTRSMCLTNLALVVFTRFNEQGRIEDLEEAITYKREALDLCPPGHPTRPTSLNNLASAVFTRFNQQGRIEDLEEAITYSREGLDLCPPGHYARSTCLNNLALAVSTRFDHQGRVEDLEEAITHDREGLDLCPPGHPGRPISLLNFANHTSSRFRRLGGMEDLEAAIKHFSEAEDTMPISHPLHTNSRSMLAVGYLLRHQSHPYADDCLPRAFRLFESAADHSTASSKTRLDVALKWVQEARRHQHRSILQAYSVSLTLLDRYMNVTPDIESQQHLLAITSSIPKSLASDAASSAIDAGQLETAVELLEQGRAILWSKLRGYRHPIVRLRGINRHLADRFEALSGQLENLAMSPRSELALLDPNRAGRALPAALDAKMRQHRITLEDWDKVVHEIRQIEGFTDFLQAVPFATLQLAATEGPVIIVNISEFRSDAIILHRMGPPVLVPLPDISPKQLATLSSQLSDARSKQPSRNIPLILRSLWNTIVHPVINELATLAIVEKSRIWWCPTSELCSLPLHAAGPYETGKRNLPDLYISSYTPTLSTLIRARSGIVPSLTTPNLLIMGQPGDQDTAAELPKVMEEINRIRSIGKFADVLVAGEANRQAVLSGLQQHNWIHFACHGRLVEQPFHSYFQLHDNERLTLLDLIQARLPSAEFAFLSACHSAAGDMGGTPNEVIHLAAGVQFSGFRSVVGTLWAMADMDGPDIAQDFYEYMFRNPGGFADFRDSAVALNKATRKMRQRKGMPIDRWINFVHIGA